VHGLGAPEDADHEWLIYGGLKPAPRWSGVVALTTSSANGGGEDVHGASAPVFGMAMGANDMP